MKKIGLLSVVVALGLLISPVLAVKTVPRSVVENRKDMSTIGKLKLWFMKNTRLLTSVGGYVCSTQPDDSGQAGDWTYAASCPDSVKGGCAIDEFDENYEPLNEETVDPGSWANIDPHHYYEIYYCSKDCQCQDDTYESQGCGKGPCEDDEMYFTRDCDCAKEKTCEWRDKCTEEQPQDTDGDGLVDSKDQCTYENSNDCASDQTFNYNTGCCEVEEEASFAVIGVDIVSTAREGETVSVDVTVENIGNTGGSTRVTTGIYADYLQGQVFSIFDTKSLLVVTSECCAGEDFSTETGSIYLRDGETKTVTLFLEAPTRNSELECGDYKGESNWGDSFTVFAAPFDECFGGATGPSAETNLKVTLPNDSDNDGVVDYKDDCTNEAGSRANGCPTTIEKLAHILFGWAGLQNWTM